MRAMPLLVTHTPFDLDRKLGRACNAFLAMLPPGSWAALQDHDMHYTTSKWFAQMHEAIAAVPDAGCFAVMTNRIASPWQRVEEGRLAGDDIPRHRQIGEARLSHRTLLDITDTKGFGGVVTIINRDAWAETEGYAETMFCCDHSIFFRLRERGRKIFLIEGLYVYHVRASSSQRGVAQEPKWKDCPCHGQETPPHSRIKLP